MSAWVCSACKGRGREWYQKSWDRDPYERTCYSCNGGGAGWAVLPALLLFWFALIAAYFWVCAGAPTHDVIENIRRAR